MAGQDDNRRLMENRYIELSSHHDHIDFTFYDFYLFWSTLVLLGIFIGGIFLFLPLVATSMCCGYCCSRAYHRC